jgi:nitroreductase
VLGRVLEAGRLAPSARNLQEWKFVVVRDPELRSRLVEAARGQSFVGEAPAVIVGCAVETEHVMTCGQHCYPIDVAIAMDHMTLAATAEGLGTCWIGAFYEDKVKDILRIPDEVRVVAIMPIGYPAGELTPRPRKPLDEVVVWDRWE